MLLAECALGLAKGQRVGGPGAPNAPPTTPHGCMGINTSFPRDDDSRASFLRARAGKHPIQLPSGGDGSAYDSLVALLKSHAAGLPSGRPNNPPSSRNQKAASSSSSSAGGGSPLLVVVLEEVDRLLDRGPDEVYKLFMLPHTAGEGDWGSGPSSTLPRQGQVRIALPHRGSSVTPLLAPFAGQHPRPSFHPHMSPCLPRSSPPPAGVNLALVAIANSLDLTERMLPALKCRGASPDFVCFPAYSKTQVQGILTLALSQLPWRVFDDGALELVARTISGTTGDLRQAFKVATGEWRGEGEGGIGLCQCYHGMYTQRGETRHCRVGSKDTREERLLHRRPPSASCDPRQHLVHTQVCRNAVDSFVDAHKQKELAAAAAARAATISPQQGPPDRPTTSPSSRPKSPAATQQQRLASESKPITNLPTAASAAATAGPVKRPVIIGLRDMLPVVRALSGGSGGGSGASASTVATVKALPTQQQLALLAASLAVAGADAAAVAVQVKGSRSRCICRFPWILMSTLRPRDKSRSGVEPIGHAAHSASRSSIRSDQG